MEILDIDNVDSQDLLYNKILYNSKNILFSCVWFSDCYKYNQYLLKENDVDDKTINIKIKKLDKYYKKIKSQENKEYFTSFKNNMIGIFMYYYYNLYSKIKQNENIDCDLLIDIYKLSYLTMYEYLNILDYKFISLELKNNCLTMFYYIKDLNNTNIQNFYDNYKYLLNNNKYSYYYQQMIKKIQDVKKDVNDMLINGDCQNNKEMIIELSILFYYIKDQIENLNI